MKMGVRRMSGGDYDLSNPLESFADTVRRVVLQPVRFFAELPRSGSLLNPLIFALICTEISAILGGILRLAGVGEGFVAGYSTRLLATRLDGYSLEEPTPPVPLLQHRQGSRSPTIFILGNSGHKKSRGC
jgi:hypothetical protein